MLTVVNCYFDELNPAWRNNLSYVEFYTFVYVTQGTVRYTLNGVPADLRKSEFLLMPPGTLREACNHPDGMHQKYAILFMPSAAEIETLPLLQAKDCTIARAGNFEYVRQRFSILYHQWSGRQPFYRTLAGGILVELLGILHRDNSMTHLSPIKLKLAEQMKAYMIENYRKPVRAAELARHIGRSVPYSISLFKETTGQTPVEFMLHLRIASARELLTSTTMTQEEIAEHLGFYDVSYFYRTFKRLAGCTPAEARSPIGRR